MIKLIASDLDSTALYKGVLSPENKKAIQKAQNGEPIPEMKRVKRKKQAPKPVEKEEPVAHTHEWTAVGQPIANQGETSVQVERCSCGAQRANLNVIDLDGKITKKGGKLGANGDTARYEVTLTQAMKGQLYVKGTVDNDQNYKKY